MTEILANTFHCVWDTYTLLLAELKYRYDINADVDLGVTFQFSVFFSFPIRMYLHSATT